MSTLLTCPACGSDQILIREETSYWANTGAHYCHSIKLHDANAKASCRACDWDGERKDLKEIE